MVIFPKILGKILEYVWFHTYFYFISKNNPIQFTPLLVINYMRVYVGVHSRIFLLRRNVCVQCICNLFEALQSLFFLIHLNQEHEEGDRFLHHLRTYKYCCVNTGIFRLYKIHKTVWIPLHFANIVCLLWKFSYIL